MNRITVISLVTLMVGSLNGAIGQQLPLERGQRVRITAPELGSESS